MIRTRLYCWTHPEGMVFRDQESVEEALKQGWVEAPWLIAKKSEGIEVPDYLKIQKDKSNGDKQDRIKSRKRSVKKG